MLISVLIPTFNRANYIAHSLESVLAQTRAPHEIIVVDDGSTDGTVEVVRRYSTIEYLRQENRGVAAARNRALGAAKGNVIAWLDSDDLWEPTFLEDTVSLLEDHQGIDGVYTGLKHIDSYGQLLEDTNEWVTAPETLFAELLRANRIATPAFVAYRSCYQEMGPFDEELLICEDLDMWLRLASQFTIVGISRGLVHIRVHDANMIGQTDPYAYYRLLLLDKWRDRLGQEEFACAKGYALRQIGFRYISSGNPEQGWHYIERAITSYPEILDDLDTLYELAIGARTRGQRSQVSRVDGTSLTSALSGLLQRNGVSRRFRSAGLGNLNLALAMLNDQAGDWAAARCYLLRALLFQPVLLSKALVVRRLVKLLLGQRVFAGIRCLRASTAVNGGDE